MQNAVSRLNNVEGRRRSSRRRPARSARSRRSSPACAALGNNTPMLNSWAGDGTYWLPKSPQVTNYYFVTYASIFGDDPNPAVNKLAKQVKAGTGGFITGSAAIDGVVTAIRRSGGSTNGATLAATMEKFKGVPTLSGKVSFSREAALGVRPAVPRDQDPEQQGAPGRHGRRQGRRRRSRRLAADATQTRVGEEARRHPPGLLCLTRLRGRAGAARRHADARPRRGRRADRPERRRQVDARERPHRLRPAGRRARSSSPARTSRAGRRTGAGGTGSRARSSTAHAFRDADGARERRGVGARRRRGAARGGAARRRAARAARARPLRGRPAAALAHGDERRLGVARALATEPRVRAARRAGRGTARGGGARLRRARPVDRAPTTARACC